MPRAISSPAYAMRPVSRLADAASPLHPATHRSEPVFVAGEAATLPVFLRDLQRLPRRGSHR